MIFLLIIFSLYTLLCESIYNLLPSEGPFEDDCYEYVNVSPFTAIVLIEIKLPLYGIKIIIIVRLNLEKLYRIL